MEAILRYKREEKTIAFLMKKDDKILSTFPFNLGWEC